MKVAISTSSFAQSDPAPLEKLLENNIQVVENPFGRKLTESEVITHLQGVDGLLAGLEPLTAKVFKSSPQLRAIARVGIGMDNVDTSAAEMAGIMVSNTPEGPTAAVAEMTIAAALALSRQILPANNALHNKQWAKSIGHGLKNLKVLIIGFGRIGQATAKLFKYFGSEVFICDPYVPPTEVSMDAKFVGLDEGLAFCDIVSLHAGGEEPVLTKHNMVNIKPGMILLNSARGNLVDESALIEALDAGTVASAWLDVFPQEPYSGKLTGYEQVLLTPHMSTYSVQCRKDMEMAAVDNLLRDLKR